MAGHEGHGAMEALSRENGSAPAQGLALAWIPIAEGSPIAVDWWVYPSPLGPIGLHYGVSGLKRLEFLPHESMAGLWAVVKRWMEDAGVSPSWAPQLLERSKLEGAVIAPALDWLNAYFWEGRTEPAPPLELEGTPFQREVWDLLQQVPRGETVTYGALAQVLAQRRGIQRMAAQAVGQAVRRNPACLMVPCHRVVGAKGQLTGYAGGVERKRQLLAWEGCQDPQGFWGRARATDSVRGSEGAAEPAALAS